MRKNHRVVSFLDIAILVCKKAGLYIKSNLGRVKNVRYKGEINLVTDVDKKAESIIVNIIKRYFPEHNILAEETTKKRKSGTDRGRSPFKWIIDPLDGTTNFYHGFPVFCVSVALYLNAFPVVGVVYDPMRDELFYAEKDKGAFLNGKRIRVSSTKDLKRALLATGFAYNIRRVRNNNIDYFTGFLKSAQAIRRAGSAAIDLCYVACGRFDGFWELYLHPWDTAAAYLIVKEAGGKITKLNGMKYSIYDKEILASNSKIHSKMINILRSK